MSGQIKSGGLRALMQAEPRKNRGAKGASSLGNGKARGTSNGKECATRTPLYRKISDTLLEGIRGGKFPVGSFLPGELELINRYGASRHTIREALRVLEDMGLVKRQRGRGCLLYTSPSPRDVEESRMPSSA